MRFQAGESDVISRVGARNFAALEKDSGRRGYDLVGAGTSLEYTFLFFNLGDLPAGASQPVAAHQAFLRRQSFRQAVSAAIDRGCHRPPGVPGAGGAPGRTGAAGQPGLGQRGMPPPRDRWSARASC